MEPQLTGNLPELYAARATKIRRTKTFNGVEYIFKRDLTAYGRGAYSARFQMFASANNLRTLPDAVEFISDAISNHFGRLGLDVEIVAA